MRVDATGDLVALSAELRGGLAPAYDERVADLYSLVHRDTGPTATFLTLAEAEDDLAAVLEDEPD